MTPADLTFARWRALDRDAAHHHAREAARLADGRLVEFAYGHGADRADGGGAGRASRGGRFHRRIPDGAGPAPARWTSPRTATRTTRPAIGAGPNAFGLRIARDVYESEMTSDPGSVHEGDGGEAVCGGDGAFVAWLPLATADRNPGMAEFLNGPEGEDMSDEFGVRPVLDLS